MLRETFEPRKDERGILCNEGLSVIRITTKAGWLQRSGRKLCLRSPSGKARRRWSEVTIKMPVRMWGWWNSLGTVLVGWIVGCVTTLYQLEGLVPNVMNDRVQYTWKDWNRIDRGLFEGTASAFMWREWESCRKTLTRIIGVAADNRTQLLLKTTSEGYHFSQLVLYDNFEGAPCY